MALVIDGLLNGSNLNNIPEHLLLVAYTVSDVIAIITTGQKVFVHLQHDIENIEMSLAYICSQMVLVPHILGPNMSPL